MSRYILALDLGTTGNRAIAFDKEGRIVAQDYAEFTQIFPREGWVEHDPVEIFETTLKVAKNVVDKVGADKIVSIGITNQRETTVIWDSETGKPLYNAVVWQCRRSDEICKRYDDVSKMIKEKTGLFLDPYFSATKIVWLMENVEIVQKRVRERKALFGTIDSWVLYCLTKGKIHATDVTNVSRTMLFNLKDLRYDDELLELFKIPMEILPAVHASNSLFGYTDKLFFGREIPINGVIGDQQASLFAHGGWREGLVKNTYGTGLFLMMSTKDRVYSSKNLIGTIAWQLDDKVEYALEGSVFVGGSLVQWLRDGLGIIKKAEDIESLAKKVDYSKHLVFVPALTGLGAPHWDSTAGGLLIGITRGTKKEDIARAALEGIAFQTRDVFEEFIRATEGEITFTRLAVDGGASKNDLLMQIQSDILGIEIERPYITESTALGAASVAAIGCGFWNIDEVIRFRLIEKEFKPALDYEKREKLYQKWLNAVERAKNWMH